MTSEREIPYSLGGIDASQAGEYWLFDQLTSRQVAQVVGRTRRWTAQPNQVIFAEGDSGDCMYIVSSGRVQISTAEKNGSVARLKQHDVGDHFGELAILSGDQRVTTATALVSTDLMELSREDFLYFVHRMPGFAANVNRAVCNWIQVLAAKTRPQPIESVALFRFSPMADRLAFQLTTLWMPTVASMTVVTDRESAWREWLESMNSNEITGRAIRLISYDDSASSHIPATSMEHKVLFDLGKFHHIDSVMEGVLNKSEQVWIAVGPESVNGMVSELKELTGRFEHLKQRSRFLWCYGRNEFSPARWHDENLAHGQTTSVSCINSGPETGQAVPADSERLVRNLQGIELGLALGGGGARGLAHFGVLKAFDDHGIRFDRIAGSSFGSLVAVYYAAGIPPAEALKIVAGAMETPAWFRWMPKNRQWYMLWAFRFAHIEKVVRNHLGKARLEQLGPQVYTVCVDLISGQPMIRESGDAARAVMESINHPGMSRPVKGNGELLVDGGVLIHLPANVLRERNCEYIVSVDIGAQLETGFAGNTSDTPLENMRYPGYLETLFRTTEVQMSRLARLHASDGDFLIKPATSNFAFDDFSCEVALFNAGYDAAVEAIPRLKREIEKLMWSVEE